MGIFVCLNCEKNDGEEGDKDKKDEENSNIINDNMQITIRDLSGTIINSQVLYNKVFEKNPMEDYRKIKEISPTKCLVSRKDDEEGKLFKMEMIVEYPNNIIDIINEILKLDQQDIIKIYYIYIFSKNYYVIYENLENNLLKTGQIDIELKFRKEIMEKLFKIINYLHEQNIYNIGLNFDNLFLKKMELKQKKKILRKKKQDSSEIEAEKKLAVYITSLSIIDILKLNYDLSKLKFYSPEVIKQIYIKKIIQKEINIKKDKNDEWGCGILLYYLITGELPFNGENIHDIYLSLDKADLDVSSPKFNKSCDSEKDLLLKLLERDEKKRISISECLNHPYFKEPIKLYSNNIDENIYDIDINILNNLLNIQKPASKFHEVVIAYLSFNFISEEEKHKINFLFNYIDTDKDNKITEEDLITVFDKKGIKYTQEQIKHILYVLDYDLNNCIQYQEFSRHLCNKRELFKEENMRKLFNSIDVNKNNYIDQQDIIGFIMTNDGMDNITIEKEFMEKFGMNVDDKITYEEFCEAIRNNKIIKKKNNPEEININQNED